MGNGSIDPRFLDSALVSGDFSAARSVGIVMVYLHEGHGSTPDWGRGGGEIFFILQCPDWF
jgi:hypothetical protein